jgi:hypothetical protein
MKLCNNCREYSPQDANYCIHCAKPFGNIGSTVRLTVPSNPVAVSGSYNFFNDNPPYLLASGVASPIFFDIPITGIRSIEDRINDNIRIAIEQNKREYIIRLTRRELLELQRSIYFGVFFGKAGNTIRMYKGFKVEVKDE